MHGKGSATELLKTSRPRSCCQLNARSFRWTAKTCWCSSPTAPQCTHPAPVRLLYEQLGARVARLDYLIALGTHPPMSEPAIDKLVGVSALERATRYPKVGIFNHAWDRADALGTLGSIPANEVEQLTHGLLRQEIEVTLNRSILD